MSTLRIIVPPGMGDIHWVMLKIRSFMRYMNYDSVDVSIVQDSKPRSGEYVKRVGMVNFAGYADVPLASLGSDPGWKSVVWESGVYVPGWNGFDYLMALNGALDKQPHEWSDILPDLETEWDYPILRSDADREREREVREKFGDYCLLFFSSNAMKQCGSRGSAWQRRITPQRLVSVLRKLSENHPSWKFLITGKAWDVPGFYEGLIQHGNRVLRDRLVNLCGDTDIGDLFALIRQARLFFGLPGGNTIMSSHFYTPTTIVWSEVGYNPLFWRNWSRPGTFGSSYQALSVEGSSPEDLVEACERAVAANDQGLRDNDGWPG